MDILKNKKVIFGILGVLVLFVLYQTFLKPEDQAAQFLVSSNRGLNGPSLEVAELLSSVQSIRLDDQIFSAATFNSLVDFSVPLTPEPVGRPNPFAPVGTVSATSTR